MYPIHFAPLQGYTEDVYRRLHNEMFGNVAAYYTPFIRFEHGQIRSKDMRDIRPEFNENVNVIPQIIAANADEARTLVAKIKELGYKRIDINMGCPFPLQTRHGKGAGILSNPEKVAEVLSVVSEFEDIEFSIKMRLGLDDSNDWKQSINIINSTRLKQVTAHPRIASQQYKGYVDMEQFDAFLSECKHPVIYNGDILSIEDIKRLEDKYGDKLSGVMIGRGLLARPSLAYEYVNGTSLSETQLIAKIKTLHSSLLEHFTSIIPGESQQLSKVRTFWDFMEETIGRKKWKKIVKAGNMKNYLNAVNDL